MKPFFKIVFLIILLFSGFRSVAQTRATLPTGWDMGLNFGFYIPSSFHAQFYNGDAANVNNIDYIFKNKYQRDEISNSLNSTDTFFITGMPSNMHYTSAFNVGIYFRRTFENDFGFAFQFNYSKLKASDFFQVEVDPYLILTEPDLRLFSIWGMEERVNFDLVFSRYFPVKSEVFLPFFEAGFNINSTRVIENKIKINQLEYSLVDVYLNGSYVPGVQQNQYTVQQGGVGWGISGTGGVKMIFNNGLSIDPGVQLLYQKINLEGYERYRPALVFFVRMSLTGFFVANE
jgi:hypothetical protein